MVHMAMPSVISLAEMTILTIKIAVNPSHRIATLLTKMRIGCAFNAHPRFHRMRIKCASWMRIKSVYFQPKYSLKMRIFRCVLKANLMRILSTENVQ